MITEYPYCCLTCCCCCVEYSSAKGLVLRFEFVRREVPLECSFVGAVRGAFLPLPCPCPCPCPRPSNRSSNGLGLGEEGVLLLTLALAGFELLSNKESKGFGDVRGGALRSLAFLEDETELLLLLVLLLLLLDDDELVEEEEDGRIGAILTASDLGDESHRRSQVDSIVDDILQRRTMQGNNVRQVGGVYVCLLVLNIE